MEEEKEKLVDKIERVKGKVESESDWRTLWDACNALRRAQAKHLPIRTDTRTV